MSSWCYYWEGGQPNLYLPISISWSSSFRNWPSFVSAFRVKETCIVQFIFEHTNMPCAGMIHPWLGQDMDRVRLQKNKDLQNRSPKKSLLGRPNEAMRFFLSSGEKTQPISLAFFVIPDPCSSDLVCSVISSSTINPLKVHVRNGWGSARKKAKESSRWSAPVRWSPGWRAKAGQKWMESDVGILGLW